MFNNPQFRGIFIRILSAFFCLHISYIAFCGRQPTTIRDKDGNVTGVYDLTVLFRVISSIALLMGLLLLVDGIRRWLLLKPVQEQSIASFPGSARFLKDGPVCLILNVAEIAIAAFIGFGTLTSSNLDATNSSATLCISILIVFTVFVIGVVSQAPGRLRAPSWNRFSLSWNRDPLQALFVTTLSTLALVVGALCRVEIRGLSTLAPFVSLLAALLIGQAIVYWCFRDQIERKQER